MGIIDYLQKYNVRKILESNGKNIIHLDIKGDLASCQDPVTYAAKF